ncbi:hypothetical protein [Nitrococcus mobilis]|uniref:Transmembrane protein n=1 Tax=Nitrococcus mobilis Nb-231 TaxID=314278 RepID=A4BQR7_9GAMM|nr:hypothetical protein [Nitrococcus mobilis]EAR21917.1 hypothetical protein NB231_06001 [Nitrococcus mobilis Nb-231]
MTTDIESTSGQGRRRARMQILIIAGLFAAPMLLAWLLFTMGLWPSGTTNHGKLIQPPQAMASSDWTTRSGTPFGRADLLGYWNLLLVVDGRCERVCLESLDLLRRLRLALGANADRVHLLLLQPHGAPAPDLPKVSQPVVFELLAPNPRIASLLAKRAGTAEGGTGVFIIDYRAFNMMTYPVPFDGSGMLDDMEHLLRVSNRQVERNQQQSQDL